MLRRAIFKGLPRGEMTAREIVCEKLSLYLKNRWGRVSVAVGAGMGAELVGLRWLAGWRATVGEMPERIGLNGLRSRLSWDG